MDGDTRSIPGWQNRAFANIVRPIIPQRVEIMLVQFAFSPFRILPNIKSLWQRDDNDKYGQKITDDLSTSTSARFSSAPSGSSSLLSLDPRYINQHPPRFLKLPVEESVEMHPKTNTKSNNANATFEQQEESSSSPVEPVIGNGANANSTREQESSSRKNMEVAHEYEEDVIGTQMHSQFDATTPHSTIPNPRDAAKSDENQTLDRRNEPQTQRHSNSNSIERQSQLFERQEEGQYSYRSSNTHPHDSISNRKDGAGDRTTRLLDNGEKERQNPVSLSPPKRTITTSPPRQDSQEYTSTVPAKKPRTRPSKEDDTETTEEDIGIGGEQIPKTKSSQRPQWFDDEHDDDETFSTRLGPI